MMCWTAVCEALRNKGLEGVNQWTPGKLAGAGADDKSLLRVVRERTDGPTKKMCTSTPSALELQCRKPQPTHACSRWRPSCWSAWRKDF